jgi:hypothetical protein
MVARVVTAPDGFCHCESMAAAGCLDYRILKLQILTVVLRYGSNSFGLH